MIDRGWTGAEATALRKALRLTVDGFARKLEASPRTVANWAANPAMVPRVAQWDRLDELLRNARPDAQKRFEELAGHETNVRDTNIRAATSPNDVLDLFEEIDNIYAQAAKADEEPKEEWTLPSGAKPVDCVAFGAMDAAVKDLIARVETLERRMSSLINKPDRG